MRSRRLATKLVHRRINGTLDICTNQLYQVLPLRDQSFHIFYAYIITHQEQDNIRLLQNNYLFSGIPLHPTLKPFCFHLLSRLLLWIYLSIQSFILDGHLKYLELLLTSFLSLALWWKANPRLSVRLIHQWKGSYQVFKVISVSSTLSSSYMAGQLPISTQTSD